MQRPRSAPRPSCRSWPRLLRRRRCLRSRARRGFLPRASRPGAVQVTSFSTLEMGKPIGDALSEVDYTVQCIAYYAEAIDKVFGEIAPTAPDSLALVAREPAGVVGAVTPWNYPLLMPAWKLGPALAAGNSVVLKPAEQTPLTAIRLGELAAEADLPPGVVNVVPGFGETAGRAVGLHDGVDVVSFTGSGGVGKLIPR